ncbi:hypothetical protein QWO17_004528 [Escherichia coli]|nr:hypothetical protein [Escherichia coli]
MKIQPVIYDAGEHRPIKNGEQISGSDVRVSSDADNIIAVSSGDGGLYAKPEVATSTTVRMSGVGSADTPISAEVICAPDTKYEVNALAETPAGLMVARNDLRDFDVRTTQSAAQGQEVTVTPGMASDVHIWNELLILNGAPGSTFIVNLAPIGHDQYQAKRLRIAWNISGSAYNTDPIRLKFKTSLGKLITPAGATVDSEWFELRELFDRVVVYDLYLFHSGSHPLLLLMTQPPSDSYVFERVLTVSDSTTVPGKMVVSLQELPCDYVGFSYRAEMYLQARLTSPSGTANISKVTSHFAGFDPEEVRSIELSPTNRTWTWQRWKEAILFSRTSDGVGYSSMGFANVTVDIPYTLSFPESSGSVEFRLFVTLTRLTNRKLTQ